MLLHHYAESGEYTGAFSAPIDPLESELAGHPVYLHPARSTEVAPPEPAAKQAAVWTGSAWTVEPDHRGETWYHGRAPVIVATLGDPAADGLTPEPDSLSLDEARAAKVAGLRAACSAHITAGFTSSALGTLHTYPNGQTDQQNLVASVLASLLPGLPADWSTPFWCMDASGAWAFAPHTAAQIQHVGADAKAFVVASQAKLAALTGQVEQAQNVDAVETVVWAD